VAPRIDLDAIERMVAHKTGAADPSAVGLMKPGAVFEVSDKLIDFPGSSEATRTWHDMRRVVVVQSHHLLGSVLPDTVTVVPCSASQHGPRRGDFRIPNGEPGFTKPNVVAYATLAMRVRPARRRRRLRDLHYSADAGRPRVPVLFACRGRERRSWGEIGRIDLPCENGARTNGKGGSASRRRVANVMTGAANLT
jgi:hypothetical protein